MPFPLATDDSTAPASPTPRGRPVLAPTHRRRSGRRRPARTLSKRAAACPTSGTRNPGRRGVAAGMMLAMPRPLFVPAARQGCRFAAPARAGCCKCSCESLRPVAVAGCTRRRAGPRRTDRPDGDGRTPLQPLHRQALDLGQPLHRAPRETATGYQALCEPRLGGQRHPPSTPSTWWSYASHPTVGPPLSVTLKSSPPTERLVERQAQFVVCPCCCVGVGRRGSVRGCLRRPVWSNGLLSLLIMGSSICRISMLMGPG